MHQWLYTKIH